MRVLLWYCVEDVSTAAMAARPKEYCQWEKFNASCQSSDDVILMVSGRYGRMKFGRCMREDHGSVSPPLLTTFCPRLDHHVDHGSVGCSADVLAYLDRQCSGRRHCELPVPDAVLHAMHRCHNLWSVCGQCMPCIAVPRKSCHTSKPTTSALQVYILTNING